MNKIMFLIAFLAGSAVMLPSPAFAFDGHSKGYRHGFAQKRGFDQRNFRGNRYGHRHGHQKWRNAPYYGGSRYPYYGYSGYSRYPAYGYYGYRNPGYGYYSNRRPYGYGYGYRHYGHHHYYPYPRRSMR